MEKLIDKLMSMRGPEYRPFAIEVSADEIRLAVYGGAKGFDEPATSETAGHTDFASCLLEGIEVLEQARLLSPSRAPYYRMPHHRCVFLLTVADAATTVVLQRRHLMRQVPRAGDMVTMDSQTKERLIHSVNWCLHDDEVHIHFYPISVTDLEAEVDSWRARGWDVRSAVKPPKPGPRSP